MNFRRPEARPPSLIARPSAKIAKRPNSTIAGGAAEANYNDSNRYFQRKSQIFGEDPAFGAA
jgi:hypothetical protein